MQENQRIMRNHPSMLGAYSLFPCCSKHGPQPSSNICIIWELSGSTPEQLHSNKSPGDLCVHWRLRSIGLCGKNKYVHIWPDNWILTQIVVLMESVMKGEYKIFYLASPLLINTIPFKLSDFFFKFRKIIRLIAHLLPASFLFPMFSTQRIGQFLV